MASEHDLQSKTNQALKKLEQAVGKSLENDRRSAVTRIMTAIVVHDAKVSGEKKALATIRQTFVNWNELRVSEERDIISPLNSVGVVEAFVLANDLRATLSDIFDQHNTVNFDYERLAEPIQRPPQADAEQAEVGTIREEGLPAHETVTGFLDGARLLSETSLLDPKLIAEKNSDAIYTVVWENPSRVPAKILYAVCIALGVVEPGTNPADGLPPVRKRLAKSDLDFARFALRYYEMNSRTIDKHFKSVAPIPVDENEGVPFSVAIGFADEAEVKRRVEAIMPRSEGIGRVSKRAIPKFDTHALSSAKPRAVTGTVAKSSRSSQSKPTSSSRSAKKTANAGSAKKKRR